MRVISTCRANLSLESGSYCLHNTKINYLPIRGSRLTLGIDPEIKASDNSAIRPEVFRMIRTPLFISGLLDVHSNEVNRNKNIDFDNSVHLSVSDNCEASFQSFISHECIQRYY